ncbi:MAG: right-handed parallel beta-helix repeat-containing protein [Bacteroidota bacterium]|nr:right-handed parallel beta-helix repeat-containing protein [Bacteroidota bacterium]
MKKVASNKSLSKNAYKKRFPAESKRLNFSGFHIRLYSLILFSGLLSLSAFSQTPDQPRDGKLLRGEKWQKFVPAENADFYVATNGNDQWSGTIPEPNTNHTDGPFLTIRRAQKAVRELKSKAFFPKDPPVEKRWIGSPHPLGKGKDILICIRKGNYSLRQQLVFGPEDGGERVETNLPTGAFEYHKLKDHYVTYAAYPGEKPVISGEVPVSGWKKNGKIWTAKYDADSVAMLVVNGKRQTLARTPNEGYFVPPAISKTTGELYFKKGEIKSWKEMENNRVVMLLRWHTGINSIIKVDEKTGIATFKSPQEGVVIVPPRYYVENVKALLDAPGEWFFDKKLKEISYIPANENMDPNQLQAGVATLNQLIEVRGKLGQPVRNLRFYGLTFEGVITGNSGKSYNCDSVDGSTGVIEATTNSNSVVIATQFQSIYETGVAEAATATNSAISFEFAHACEFVGGEIRSCSGIGLLLKNGCYQTRILNSRFETIDDGGIYANGLAKPDDGRKIIRETIISHNKLYDCGGVNIYANNTLMTTISHNYITKTRGRYGIDVGGWMNQEEAIDGGYVVEYNHLDDVQRDADDSGAIKTAGMTFNSVIRRNLIHDVRAGFFNDNVGFWFDNMSSGWTCEENIYYNLEQGEWKLCAALIEDNIYRNNFKIEAPVIAPETIIEGEPEFETSNLKIDAASKSASGAVLAGSVIHLSSDVFNRGASGIAPVELYLDGKVYEKKLFPVVKSNSRKIEFEVRIYDAGEHQLAIGSTPYQSVKIEGNKPSVVFENFKISDIRMLKGEKLKANATAKNMTSDSQKMTATLFIDNLKAESQSIELKGKESREIGFVLEPQVGSHAVRIENSAEKSLTVFEAVTLDISRMEIHQYCSVKAKPYEIEADAKANRFKITASGSDFYHAEDSYAAAYLKGIKGDFVATVKINQFGDRTHEWFRSGLFVRNDIAQSFDVQPGSKGSVLVFGTPGRAGIEYDEFANGCMHKASSQNLPEHSKTPIYLKIVRHGNSFSGYISMDGKNWIIERHTADIPGIADVVDLGLAAGGPDKRPYWVEFTDWKIEVAK